ncbi:platelet glycoprotein Ib alpha chain-like isoform X3 [Ostrea edulis]|uniref:platelet glycoprotein Ib alpha chain-like isoform X3 n=1 Tax=Ostrea edulis TaxID=37623 RepID=UPI0024AFC746|nr:platelet glycoprotein Ib alpha chain-like isoform X3 [Ostrea edulis]
MAWMTMIILMVNSFGIYYSEGSDSRHKISKSITLHQSQESSIKSPGYPTKHYEKDTVYIWTVTAPGTTEEITINILDLDIQYTPGIPCDDYLKIQDTDDENFAISKQCEKPWRKTVVAKGNKLKITLFSNYDRLTGKGFNLILRVTKTKPTTTQPTTKGIPTTTPVPMTSPTSVQTTTKHLDLNLSSTNMGSLKTNVTTLTTSITTTAMKTATATTKTSTILLTLTSEKTIPTMTPTNTPTLSTANEVLNNASSTRNATTVISTTVSASFPSGTFISSRSTQHSSVQSITNSTPTQSFTPLQMNETTIISSSAGGSTTAVQAVGNATKTTQTSTESETTSTAFFQEETLLLVLAIAVVEMTVLVIGVLAVRRQRQKRVTITRRPIEGNNRPVSRKTIYSMPNVYDVIPFDEVDDSDEENPYKDLQDGVYDTTFKRRSRLSGKPNRDDSRGSYFSHFLRNSKIFGSWKLKENQPMEMKTFRG